MEAEGIHELLARRRSPRAFADRPVEPQVVRALLEAARWAPSSFNEQPWRFVVAPREEAEAFERLASCLTEGNAWARKAPLLLMSCARTAFERNGRPNRHAFHDVGLAAANLTVEATARGLAVHQMAGILPDRAREVLAIPPEFEPVAGIAAGYPGDPESLPEPLRERERAVRTRRPLSELAFAGRWGASP